MGRLTAPIQIIKGAQANDIAASKGPSDVFDECYRVKQYIKDDAFGPCVGARSLDFDQPYQVASHATELPWGLTNRTFLGQLMGCNLKCDYCYIGEECSRGDAHDVTPQEYVQAYLDYNLEFPDKRAGVLRVSGGEPMLRQRWAAETSRIAAKRGIYTWIDTNGTISPDPRVWKRILNSPHVGVNICFKPNAVSLDHQLRVAAQFMLLGGNVFFYWPSYDFVLTRDILMYMNDCILGVVQRLTVIKIRRYSACARLPVEWTDEAATKRFTEDRCAHMAWLGKSASSWQPSHLTKLLSGPSFYRLRMEV